MGIKMICSDLDGTILSYTQTEITEKMLGQIRRFRDQGIIFVPTSGRMTSSRYPSFCRMVQL